jgi:hypothetical protein
MFHTYVTASSGRQVDIDRAHFMMDHELFDQVDREVRTGATTEAMAQRVWAGYCQAHLAKYGTPFAPDVAENWDA